MIAKLMAKYMRGQPFDYNLAKALWLTETEFSTNKNTEQYKDEHGKPHYAMGLGQITEDSLSDINRVFKKKMMAKQIQTNPDKQAEAIVYSLFHKRFNSGNDTYIKKPDKNGNPQEWRQALALYKGDLDIEEAERKADRVLRAYRHLNQTGKFKNIG